MGSRRRENGEARAKMRRIWVPEEEEERKRVVDQELLVGSVNRAVEFMRGSLEFDR